VMLSIADSTATPCFFRALDEASSSARKKQGVAVESAIESITTEWSEKLSKAVEDEGFRWEKKYALLQADYKGIEPRYKAIHSELTTKSAALELDVSFVKAELQKVKDELANEKEKHKAVRKTLKKTRAKLADTASKLEDVNLTHSFLTKTHEIMKDESSVNKKELEATKLKLKETDERGKTTKAELVLSKEACSELQRQLVLSKQSLEERAQEMQAAKEAHAEAFESARKEYAVAAEIARAQLADAAAKLMAQEEESATLLTETTSKLIEATNQIQLSEQRLAQKEAALTASDAQVQAERSRYERTLGDLNCAQAEAAALAAVAASGALGLAHVSTQIKQLHGRVDQAIGGVAVLCEQPKSVRTAQLEWGDGDALGIELGAAEGKLGARVYALSGVAAKNKMLSLGDVILAINDTPTLAQTIEEVAGLLGRAGSKITLVVASADQVDMDHSPFEMEKNAAETRGAAVAAVAVEPITGEERVHDGDSAAPAPAPALALATEGVHDTDGDDANGNVDTDAAAEAAAAPSLAPPAEEMTLVDAATKATEAKLSQAMNELQQVETVVDSLVSAINGAEASTTSQVALFRESQRKASRLEQMIVLMRLEKAELDSKHTSAKQTIVDTKAEILQIRTDYNAVTSKVMELGTRMVQTETARKGLEIEKAAETVRADNEQAQKDAAQAELGNTTAALEKTKENLDAKMEGLASAQEALGTATNDILARDAAMQEATVEIAGLKENLEMARSGEYAMSQELIQTSVRADSMEEKVAELTVQTETQLEKMAELEGTLRQTQASENQLLRTATETNSDESKSSAIVLTLQAELDSERLEKQLLEAGLSEAISELAVASEANDNLELAKTEIASLRAVAGQSSSSGVAAIAGVGASPNAAIELEQEKSNVTFAKRMLAKAELEKAELEREVLQLKGGMPATLEKEVLQQWRSQCGKLETDVANANEALAKKEQELKQQVESLRAAKSKIKELEKIVGMQATSRHSLEEILLEQSEESDDLRKQLEEHRESTGSSTDGTGKNSDNDGPGGANAAYESLQRRTVECEQLLSLGTFERQALQEALTAAQFEIVATEAEKNSAVENKIQSMQKVLKVFGVEIRSAKVTKTEEGLPGGTGWGVELCQDLSTGYTGIKITTIRPKSPIAFAPAIRIGDYIVGINGLAMLGDTYEDVVKTIKDAGETMTLSVASAEDLGGDDGNGNDGEDN